MPTQKGGGATATRISASWGHLYITVVYDHAAEQYFATKAYKFEPRADIAAPLGPSHHESNVPPAVIDATHGIGSIHLQC